MWSDKSNMDYVNWHTGEPSENLATTVGNMDWFGKWSLVAETDTPRPYVCKYNPHKMAVDDRHDYRGELMKCETDYSGKNWTEVGEYCIRGHHSRYPWAIAEENCRSSKPIPAHLVSVHDMHMNTEILHEVTRLSHEQSWIGLTRLDERGFQWTDGSTVEFTQWESGYPNK